jgi:hypothetical protein
MRVIFALLLLSSCADHKYLIQFHGPESVTPQRYDYSDSILYSSEDCIEYINPHGKVVYYCGQYKVMK